MRTTVLVEGRSDEVALRALARSWGHQLLDDVKVLALGGITNIRSVATRLHADGHTLAGLYDAPEVGFVRRGLAVAGAIPAEDADLEAYGSSAAPATSRTSSAARSAPPGSNA